MMTKDDPQPQTPSEDLKEEMVKLFNQNQYLTHQLNLQDNTYWRAQLLAVLEDIKFALSDSKKE